ncbi:hypothetical protein TNIN_357051 [Trichonephila inaurata madagascariensis]|uniref:Uncharacterized protein n=1 Tax=Trichonephila inaurata madagascariensis TaxID=2747483 RepID=A0A8X7C6Y7_9ARAC|nr:hypothetical protein TNIN_357051 [Trichonephila inaurata madagascariensis]
MAISKTTPKGLVPITIPGLCVPKYKYDEVCRSPEQARACAASDILRALNIFDANDHITVPGKKYYLNPFSRFLEKYPAYNEQTAPNSGINNHFLPPVQQQSNLSPYFQNPFGNNVLTAFNAANTSILDANSPHEGFLFSNHGQSDTFQERYSLSLTGYDYLLSSTKI